MSPSLTRVLTKYAYLFCPTPGGGKFYEVFELADGAILAKYGKVGAAGKVISKHRTDTFYAVVNEKTRKGYSPAPWPGLDFNARLTGVRNELGCLIDWDKASPPFATSKPAAPSSPFPMGSLVIVADCEINEVRRMWKGTLCRVVNIDAAAQSVWLEALDKRPDGLNGNFTWRIDGLEPYSPLSVEETRNAYTQLRREMS
jgi:hypothetical protein